MSDIAGRVLRADLARAVVPDHPTIGELLSEAEDLLGPVRHDPSLGAEQERSDALVRAVCLAAQTLVHRYEDLPSDWIGAAHSVRSPEDVLVGSIGTSLDLTLVLAAALERGGIRPIVVVLRGHALLGYSRSGHSLTDAVGHDAASFAEQVRSGRVGLVETALLTGADPIDFDRAQDDLLGHRLGGHAAEDFIAAIDVVGSRAGSTEPREQPIGDAHEDVPAREGGTRQRVQLEPVQTPAVGRELRDQQADDFTDRFERFTPWARRGTGTKEVLDALPRAAASRQVAAVMADIVQHEGLISRARLARLAAAEFGLLRVNADREKAILRALDPSYRRSEDRAYAWPPGLTPSTWTGYRWSAEGDDRDVQQISPVELANTMRDLLRGSDGLATEPLFRRTLARFGARRLTDDVRAHLRSASRVGVELGKLVIDGSGRVRAA